MLEEEFLSTSPSKIQLKPTCIYAVSTGQPYHEGENLARDIKYINTRFSYVTIINADYLQRHTLQITSKSTPEEASSIALANGSDWEERNQKYLSKLVIPHEIVRWNMLRDNEEFQAKLILVEQLYRENNRFRKAVNKAAGNFVRRYESKGAIIKEDLDKCIIISKEYIIEECAGTMLFGEPNYLVYPSKLNGAVEYICKVMQEDNPNIMRIISSNELISSSSTLFISQRIAVHPDLDHERVEFFKEMLISQMEMVIHNQTISEHGKRKLIEEIVHFAKQKLATDLNPQSSTNKYIGSLE